MDAPARSDATAPVPGEQLAALREEIRRAGRRVYLLRRAWLAVPFLGFAAFVLTQAWVVPIATHRGSFRLGLFALLGTLVTALVICSRGAERLLHAARAQLRDQLVALPRKDALRVLSSLQVDTAAMADELAEALLRDLSLPTELTPAGTPEGGGAEVTGVER